MNELKSLVKELKEVSQLASVDVDNVGDRSTRPSREMARNQARDRLSSLQETYANTVLQNVFTFTLVGPEENSLKFAHLAKETGALVVDSQALYETLALRCKQTMGGVTFGLTQFMALEAELSIWARNNKINMMPLKYISDVNVVSNSEIVAQVRQLIEGSNGQSLARAYVKEQVLKQAVEEEVDSKVVPVVVLNSPEILTFSNGRGILVDTNTEINEEFVTKTFNQAKKVLKGN